jgi:hypothetical protein
MVICSRTFWLGTGLLLALATLQVNLTTVALAQNKAAQSGSPSHPAKDLVLPGRLPDQPSQPPAFAIPIDSLGFSPPSPTYLGQRYSQVSLDFFDEDRLLFSFRVPGLLHREPGTAVGSDEHQIRAAVLTLPSGRVEAEALWTLHDRSRYMWMLKDGHFLLRDRDELLEGDASLELKPLLQFPGSLLWVEVDPTQQFLVTDSREPEAIEPKAGQVTSPATAAAEMQADGQDASPPDLVVRILHRATGKVLLVSRVRTTVRLPINSTGYLEGLRGRGLDWVLNLNYFTGGSTTVGHINSICAPIFAFISDKELLATGCDSGGGSSVEAMTTDGRRLWEDMASPESIWPVLVMAANGTRLARETLAINHSTSVYAPIYDEDIKGQMVRILDAASGKVALEAPVRPVLDAGGNVAISPSGRRVAVLNAGAIQIFDLPAPPALPDAAQNKPAP